MNNKRNLKIVEYFIKIKINRVILRNKSNIFYLIVIESSHLKKELLLISMMRKIIVKEEIKITYNIYKAKILILL